MGQKEVRVRVPVTGARMKSAENGKELWAGASVETPLGEVELEVAAPSVPVSHSIRRIARRSPTSPACGLAIGKRVNKRRGRCRNRRN